MAIDELHRQPKKSRFRAARPLVWWLFLVIFLYVHKTHERLMARTRLVFDVSLEGQPAHADASATLDGIRIYQGQNISLGSHSFVLLHPKGTSYTTNFFAWYGETHFG